MPSPFAIRTKESDRLKGNNKGKKETFPVRLGVDEAVELSVEGVYERLDATPEGLTSAEADKRLAIFGSNEIVEKKTNPIIKFLGAFWGPIPWMIEFAVIISAAIGHWADFFIISTLLILNAVVGFWQERKADNAIDALKERLALESSVLRDGRWTMIPARNLVPGDIVKLRIGSKIPADVKLIDGEYLSADESALTGESLPVDKFKGDTGYAGAVVHQGEMKALVVSTGMNTYFGKTAKLIEEGGSAGHFQKAIVAIGNYLILLSLVLVVVIFAFSLWRQESLLETLQFALVLCVAAIPAALPAVLSVTLAIGATALAKKEAIVSKLTAIEELSGMDILCSDKTGTITQNKISVAAIHVFEPFTEADALIYGGCSSEEENHDPIDDAIISRAMEKNGNYCTRFKISNFKPFDPVRKMTEATIQEGDNEFKVAKGAPQAIMGLISSGNGLRKDVGVVVDSFAAKGYRSLGIAITDKNGDWQYVGLIGLHDPPREDSAQTIITAQKMGVKVKMVTGDHAAIAKQIAAQVNLGTDIAETSTFIDKPVDEATEVVENADGFAQVYPEHKYRIVELLQDKDHIVGMTGDGVNDAPALKKADVGIAVKGSTDAAKAAADIVLTRIGLSVIIDSMKESRKIFHRMTNYATYRIAETIRVLLFITISIIAFNFYPVTALMIVLLALLNDAPIMTIAYDNVRYTNKPRRWDMKDLLTLASFLGIIGVVSSFFIFYIGNSILNLDHTTLQSFIYLKLSLAGHLTVFVARTRGPFWSIRPSKSLFSAVIITQLIATLITVYGILLPAMGWELALFVWGYSLMMFLVTDILKTALCSYLDKKRGVVVRSLNNGKAIETAH